MDDLARRYLAAKQDSRPVTTDASARYFGVAGNDLSLILGGAKRQEPVSFGEWQNASA